MGSYPYPGATTYTGECASSVECHWVHASRLRAAPTLSSGWPTQTASALFYRLIVHICFVGALFFLLVFCLHIIISDLGGGLCLFL